MSIRTHNQLMDLSLPRVMAIINFSPDSFYTSCDTDSELSILEYADRALREGADILDLGACSTRPHSTPVSSAVEWQLLSKGLEIIRHHWHDIPISVDTFRPEIALQAISHGADIINDVSGGTANSKMWKIVAQQHVPYILTHAQTIKDDFVNPNPTTTQILDFLQEQLDYLHQLGVADVIIDPGFGFGKTIEQNYQILNQLNILETLNTPILVGISRKSMLYQPLNTTPQNVLAATIAANTLALERGAHILRVHDTAAAKQAIQTFLLTHNS